MTGAADGNDAVLAADERVALIAAHERRVEALRDSAQYRVGELVIASARSPRRLVRLPVDLWRLRKELLAKNLVAPLESATTPPGHQVVVATILDELSQQAFAPEWDQRPIRGTPTVESLESTNAALLFVEPLADGGGPWRDATVAASQAGIPTVFWSSAGPAHLDEFADAPRHFDWIFTTDAECLERYVTLAGHDRVAALPFAVQPRAYNPIGAPTQRVARAAIVGRWPARCDGMLRSVFDAGMLDVLDPVGGAARPADYRRYACFVDIDSVTTSPTMCSRRVFELLACRTPVVSTPSRAIAELFGDTVITVETPADARHAVEKLAGDPEHRDRVGQLGYRAVLAQHTYAHRVDQVLSTLGIASPSPAPRMTVLAPTNRPEYLDRLIDNFSRQRDVTADLIVLTNSERFDQPEVDRRLASIPRARAIHLAAGLTMGECLNIGLAATDARFVAKFDDDDHYGAHYLHDALLVHRYVDAAIVGKKTFFAFLEGADETVLRSPGNEFTAANRVSGSTMVIDRQLFPDARFAALNLGEDIDLCERAISAGHVVFSADRFNYVAVRRHDARTHSWTINENEYRIGAVRVASGLALDRTMV